MSRKPLGTGMLSRHQTWRTTTPKTKAISLDYPTQYHMVEYVLSFFSAPILVWPLLHVTCPPDFLQTWSYGKDYHNYFDVEIYLDFYREPKLNEFQYVARHEFWSRLAPRKNFRVLNFGGGPVISDLISAAPFVKEIIFAEYSERNRQAVEKWRQNLPDSHDWSAHFRFIL